jgi:hypothetical protein
MAPVQRQIRRGDFMWELIAAPRDKDGIPSRSLSGRYRVKLYIMVQQPEIMRDMLLLATV